MRLHKHHLLLHSAKHVVYPRQLASIVQFNLPCTLYMYLKCKQNLIFHSFSYFSQPLFLFYTWLNVILLSKKEFTFALTQISLKTQKFMLPEINWTEKLSSEVTYFVQALRTFNYCLLGHPRSPVIMSCMTAVHDFQG